MSSAARPFLPEIRRLDGLLSLPVRDRVHILQELEFDLEELAGSLVAQGLSEEDARARAMEALAPDPGVILQLGLVHEPLYRRATGYLGEDRLRLFERLGLAVAVGLALAGQTVALLRTNLSVQAVPLLAPVLVLGAVLIGYALYAFVRIVLRGERMNARERLAPILVLSGVIVLTGLAGTFVDFTRLAAVLEAGSDDATRLVAAWLYRDSVLLAMCILLALGGALSWFGLSLKISLEDADRRRLLDLERSPDPSTGG